MAGTTDEVRLESLRKSGCVQSTLTDLSGTSEQDVVPLQDLASGTASLHHISLRGNMYFYWLLSCLFATVLSIRGYIASKSASVMPFKSTA